MSQTETHIGKFKIIAEGKDSILKYIKEHNLEKFFDTTINGDIFSESEYYEVLNDNNILIEFIEHREYGEDDAIVEFNKNNDGTIDFLVQFYNGGCCLQEVLEDYKNYVGE